MSPLLSSRKHKLNSTMKNLDGAEYWFSRKGIVYNLVFVASIGILFFRTLSSTSIGVGVGVGVVSVSSDQAETAAASYADDGSGGLRFMNKVNNNDPDNRFSFTTNASPYEQIWVNNRLPGWAKKRRQFRLVEDTIPPEQRICFVHVGKAGGSSVGCALGFSLHCNNSTQQPLDGLLPQRATRMFHADTYDCHDDSAYFLFVVRSPVERLKSAYLYERPTSESSLKRAFPEYYERRKNLYIDCPTFGTMESFVQDGLRSDGHADDICKSRAITSVRGTQHFSCHMYFNYQFHLEGIPKGAKILTIRNEHLTTDWNGIELYIGGTKDIIPSDKANETIGVVNKSTQSAQDKELSAESTLIVCQQLCNEIVNYKKILRSSLNLSYMDVAKSFDELRETCGRYAEYEEGECPVSMPNIKEKLISTRGYIDLVNMETYITNKERLETLHHWPTEDSDAEAEETMDDDSYPMP